jgi:hypothetical protein
MGCDSDGTSVHEEWFEGGRRSVYNERLVGVGGFPFLLSLLVLLYSKASYDFETVSTLVLFCRVLISSTLILSSLAQLLILHYCYQFHLRSTPPVTLSANLECFDCHFNQYESNWMSNLMFLCTLTIVIP